MRWAVAATLALSSVAEAQTPQARLSLWDAVDQAIVSHPSVRVSNSQLEAARHRQSRAASDWIPSIQLEASATRFQEDMIVRPLHAFDPSNPPDFNATLLRGGATASFTIWDGSRSYRIGAAREGVEAERARMDRVEQSLTLRVVEVYAQVIAMRSTLEAAVASVDAFEAELDRATRLVEAEAAPRVEVLRAQAALEVGRADLSSAQLRTDALLVQLARLVGLPNAPEPEALAEATVHALPSRPDDRDVIEDNPVIEAAVRSAEAARATASAARGTRWPTLRANAGYQWFAAPSTELTGEWQLGVGFRYPLFSRGTSARINEADAAVEESQARVDQIQLDLLNQTDAAFTELSTADARVTAFQAAVNQFQEVRRIEQLSLESGAGVQSDYLRTEAQVFETRSRLASARADRLVALARLLLARGDLLVSNLRNYVEVVP